MVVEQVNQSVLEDLIETKKVVVADFFAAWCGPCKMLHPIFERVAENNQNLTFVRIDVDQDFDLAAKLGIQSIPTIIVFKDGKEVARKLGFMGQEDFEKFIKASI